MNKIPKDFAANKLPRQMAHKKRKRTTDTHERISGAATVLAFVCILVSVIGFSVVIFSNQRKPNPSEIKPLGAPVLEMAAQSATPFQPETAIPTETHALPTRTPQPTKTARPVSDNVQNKHVIRYETIKVTQINIVERVVEITKVVTVVHTVNPKPTHTPQPTVNAYATQMARGRKLDYSRSLRNEFIAWGLTFVGGVASIGLFMRACWVTIQHWRRDKFASVEQSRDEIINKSNDDVMMLLDRSIQIYGERTSRLAGWRDIDDWTAEQWGDAIETLESRQCAISRVPSKGTYIMNGTLRMWKTRMQPPYSSRVREQS